MENLTNKLEAGTYQREQEELEDEIVPLPEGDTVEEKLYNQMIKAYEIAWNQANPNYEIRFATTVTKHRIQTPDGRKTAAYLRLTRYISQPGKKWEVWDKEDNPMLVHHEAYFFKNSEDKLRSDYRPQLFLNATARLVAGGLEYAELLKRMKQIEDAKAKLEVTDQMPAPLTPQDEKYKEWLKQERAKEGL